MGRFERTDSFRILSFKVINILSLRSYHQLIDRHICDHPKRKSVPAHRFCVCVQTLHSFPRASSPASPESYLLCLAECVAWYAQVDGLLGLWIGWYVSRCALPRVWVLYLDPKQCEGCRRKGFPKSVGAIVAIRRVIHLDLLPWTRVITKWSTLPGHRFCKTLH